MPPKDAEGRPSASLADPPDEDPLGELLTARKDYPEPMARHDARGLPRLRDHA